MKILVTGSAGFIGSALSIKLLDRGDKIIGIDNHNDYYDPKLKDARLSRHADHPNYTHIRMNIEDRKAIARIFEDEKFDGVVNLAAQAGVRYSIENPQAYIDTNLLGFANILEGCRHQKVDHLVYASSSSTYGLNTKQPFSIHDSTDHPLSLYAATKKANELMAHTYSHLYNLPTTGLRFFTVYGQWGRPDMFLFKLFNSFLLKKIFYLNNSGNHMRDFTYIDDVVEITKKLLFNKKTKPNHSIFNVCSNKPIKITKIIDFFQNSSKLCTSNFLNISQNFLKYIKISQKISKFMKIYKKSSKYRTSQF